MIFLPLMNESPYDRTGTLMVHPGLWVAGQLLHDGRQPPFDQAQQGHHLQHRPQVPPYRDPHLLEPIGIILTKRARERDARGLLRLMPATVSEGSERSLRREENSGSYSS